jgi:hypothetical protein
MSSKRYQFKILESAELADFEQQLGTLGAQGWSAVGYGILPNGSRSALLERKREHPRTHHHDRDHHRRDRVEPAGDVSREQ